MLTAAPDERGRRVDDTSRLVPRGKRPLSRRHAKLDSRAGAFGARRRHRRAKLAVDADVETHVREIDDADRRKVNAVVNGKKCTHADERDDRSLRNATLSKMDVERLRAAVACQAFTPVRPSAREASVETKGRCPAQGGVTDRRTSGP